MGPRIGLCIWQQVPGTKYEATSAFGAASLAGLCLLVLTWEQEAQGYWLPRAEQSSHCRYERTKPEGCAIWLLEDPLPTCTGVQAFRSQTHENCRYKRTKPVAMCLLATMEQQGSWGLLVLWCEFPQHFREWGFGS
jgi:hypothetical protein